ncbi:hypothetical protein ARMSODRAFT_959543 [Armillaria solidipes]|uniref:Uncharacterized protein n=1 Tax=Armillaria solidipes TaxID=1076256 RepID=A0A2H3BQL9_9AGAR|nr:hypothetical protein ARMSODRAFT_959543 [Armillaria solidipes]
MSYYRGTNCPQTYIPGPSPSSHHDTYWRMAHGSYPTPPPIPARLSEENLARLDRGQARSSIFMSQTYSTNRPFPSFQPSSRFSIGPSYPPSRSGTMYSSPSPYSSDSRRTPTPSISPYSSPGAPLSRIHSPFSSPPPPPPPYISPNPKRYLDANTPPRPRFRPSHNYPDPRPLVHRSPAYQQPTHFDNGDRNPYYGRTRFPPNNVPGAFSHLQNPRYTPRGEFESDEEDSDSDESGDSEFSTGSSLTSGSEFFEEDSYDGDYEDAAIYESPGDAATL